MAEAAGSSGATRFCIYTRTGDSGTSSLYNGDRRDKDDLVFAALGDVDELNSAIGLAREHCAASGNGLEDKLEEIQSRLFDAGSAIATPSTSSSERKVAQTRFDADAATRVEGWIDSLDEHLPPLTNFILPSGGVASAHLHVARSVCRRAERAVVPLVRSGDVEQAVGVYLNRLSDFLFVAARTAAKHDNAPEKIWRKAA